MLKNRYAQEDREIIMEIKYRDLCYATSKCFTECLKKYGFMGFSSGSYGDEINIIRLNPLLPNIEKYDLCSEIFSSGGSFSNLNQKYISEVQDEQIK